MSTPILVIDVSEQIWRSGPPGTLTYINLNRPGARKPGFGSGGVGSLVRLAAAAYPSERAEPVERLLPHLEAYYKAWEMPALTPYTVYNSKR